MVLEDSETVLSIIDKVRMAKDTAAALQYCHNIMKIIHRDLQASHVMV